MNTKVAILMNQNAYAGREYSSHLLKNGIPHSILEIGSFPEYDQVEDERCQGMWRPSPIQDHPLIRKHAFPKLSAVSLLDHLTKAKYDVGIQGGTGIIKPAVFEAFKMGILNFHPGDLPKYRGCSAPEWQLVNGDPIVITCHLVAAGIDTGKIVGKRLVPSKLMNYAAIRAAIYPSAAQFVTDTVMEIEKAGGVFPADPIVQDEDQAVYRKYIGDDQIEFLRSTLPHVAE